MDATKHGRMAPGAHHEQRGEPVRRHPLGIETMTVETTDLAYGGRPDVTAGIVSSHTVIIPVRHTGNLTWTIVGESRSPCNSRSTRRSSEAIERRAPR
jgi:hypothetical protein